MHLRRTFATTAAVVLLAAPLLSSCGFNLATDRPYTPGAGVIDVSGTVKILSAVIVSTRAGEGTFVATLSNTDDTTPAVFDSLSGTAGNTVTPGDFDEITIAPRGFVNLATDGGIKVNGGFVAGDFVPVAIGFKDGSSADLNVVVVTACHAYEGLDPAVSESATPTLEPSDAPETLDPSTAASPNADGGTEAAQPSAQPSAEPSDEPSATPSAYDCDYATADEE